MNTNLDGLTQSEVRDRISRGLVNKIQMPRSKTVGQIIKDHVLTYFVWVNLSIFGLILMTGRWLNTLFMVTVLLNILIGIIQEIRAKRVLDRLSVLTAVKATVRRESKEMNIPLEDLVLDDICLLQPGDQIGADGRIVDSDQLEVDESLLTGEVEPVLKLPGDQVLSGSYIVAGKATMQVVHVGPDNYAQQITVAARRYKKAHSEILATLNKMIRLIALFILPTGLLLFLSQYYRQNTVWQDAVVGAAAGMIGMIPEGLILLTSLALAIGIIRLARQRAVVQDLSGIEILARVNVLCLDKTGTLTTGSLHLTEVIPLGTVSGQEIMDAVAATVAAFPEKNSTAQALADYFNSNPQWQTIAKVPFSSYRRWSGASFADHQTWLIGAPETLLGEGDQNIGELVRRHAEMGDRVIVLARSNEILSLETLPTDLQPIALFLLADAIRPEARAAIGHFLENDVTVKILSGDNPATVAAIARKLELPDCERFIDAATIPDDPAELAASASYYTIFGRVTPQMKQKLIQALKSQDHIVAMAGDGVNDVLALREADCGIALASGSEAAKNIAHIILLDSNFNALPAAVREGRQVINNIERVASLFLTKTSYSALLSLTFILLGLAYPFYPIHKTLISGVSIGIPAFFLTLEINIQRTHPGFLGRVLRQAVPGGICVTAGVLLVRLIQSPLNLDAGQTRTMTVIVAGLISLTVLYRISRPLNRLRIFLILSMTALFLSEMILFARWLELSPLGSREMGVAVVIVLFSYQLQALLGFLFRNQRIYDKIE